MLGMALKMIWKKCLTAFTFSRQHIWTNQPTDTDTDTDTIRLELDLPDSESDKLPPNLVIIDYL